MFLVFSYNDGGPKECAGGIDERHGEGQRPGEQVIDGVRAVREHAAQILGGEHDGVDDGADGPRGVALQQIFVLVRKPRQPRLEQRHLQVEHAVRVQVVAQSVVDAEVLRRQHAHAQVKAAPVVPHVHEIVRRACKTKFCNLGNGQKYFLLFYDHQFIMQS
jgi:hypothetical protein